MGTEASTFHIDGMHEDGDQIPATMQLVEVPKDTDGIVAITVAVPDKKRRINLTLDATLIDQIEANYGERAISGFFEEAARRSL